MTEGGNIFDKAINNHFAISCHISLNVNNYRPVPVFTDNVNDANDACNRIGPVCPFPFYMYIVEMSDFCTGHVGHIARLGLKVKVKGQNAISAKV